MKLRPQNPNFSAPNSTLSQLVVAVWINKISTIVTFLEKYQVEVKVKANIESDCCLSIKVMYTGNYQQDFQ